MSNKENIEKFESLLQSVKREGIDNLLAFIRKSDFYTALARWLRQGGHIESFLKHRRKNS